MRGKGYTVNKYAIQLDTCNAFLLPVFLFFFFFI